MSYHKAANVLRSTECQQKANTWDLLKRHEHDTQEIYVKNEKI